MAKQSLLKRWRDTLAGDTWVKPFLGSYRKPLVLSLVLGVLAMIFASALMFTSGYLIDASAERPELGVFALFVPLAMVQIFGIGKPFLSYFERLQSHDWVLRVTSQLRLRLYRAIEQDGLLWASTNRLGDALGLLSQDIEHIQNLYLRTVFPLVIAWAVWVIAVILLGLFSPLFALGMLLGLGVLAILMPLVSVLVNGARQMRVKDLDGQLFTEVYDNVAGVADWQFAQRTDEYVERVMAVDAEITDAGRASKRFARNRDLASQLLFGLLCAAMLVWAGVHFGAMGQAPAFSGTVDRPADWIAAFVLGLFPLMEAFQPLPDGAVEASSHLDAVERMNQRNDPGNGIEAKPTPGTANHELVLESLSFTYTGEAKPVLRDIDLCIDEGEKIALLGPSGAGKSTLVALVRGTFQPTMGSVTLGGVPTSQFGDAMAQHIAVIQQDTYLFNQTLIENLRIGNALATYEEATEALERVGLGPLLKRLPDGLDTLVDEGGLRFSGGERHRIALARVLLEDAPIVILDEPTVSLDPFTERALLSTMFEVLEGRTVLMVTHHLLGVEHMDRVIFLEEGRIALEGSPGELATTNARYQQLLAFDRGL